MHDVSVYSLIPFALMLLSIAILPLVKEHWWEQNKNKLIISLSLSIPIVIYLITSNLSGEIVHVLLYDYIPFIILIGSLYVITGGIFIEGDLPAKPITNAAFLAIGAVLASLIGTTGAAMLLIRPLIHTNKERRFKSHTILFFIAIVANCGGLLTPLGDPPLFMMYLRGVDFFWFFNFYKEWLVTNSLLILIFFFMDKYHYNKETIEDKLWDLKAIRDIKVDGKFNFILLLLVVLSIAFINKNYVSAIEANPLIGFLREGVLLLLVYISLKATKRIIRISNSFTYEPIKEVAYLFLGIFITMIPCLIYLQTHAKELAITTPTQFYYFTGLFSSFLDNAPTAITFHSMALGLPVADHSIGGIPGIIMEAICIGAVMWGSMTYIGNGPNFLIKSIAENNNIKMPGFFAYILKFSLLFLLPVYILVQLLFIHY